jgi:rhamnogalacturonan endolyase
MSLAFAAAVALSACTGWGTPGKQLYADDFSGSLGQWTLEHRKGPGSRIAIERGKLLMDVNGGATAWFNKPLSGNYLISFRRKVLVEGGTNDRLSDFNMFWAARDPAKATLFTRQGVFEEYDKVRMYYVGIGGNTNTTTRLRRYDGTGERLLLAEYLDQAHLLAPNRDYKVQIAVYDGCTSVTVDGETWFSYRDPQPLTDGYFGFRTTQSRQQIDDFKVHQLK